MKTDQKTKSPARRWLNRFGNTLLLILALLWLVPFIWTLLISVRPKDEPIVNGNVFFGSRITAENFQDAFDTVDWGQQYVTTLTFVFGVLAVQLVTITLAG